MDFRFIPRGPAAPQTSQDRGTEDRGYHLYKNMNSILNITYMCRLRRPVGACCIKQLLAVRRLCGSPWLRNEPPVSKTLMPQKFAFPKVETPKALDSTPPLKSAPLVPQTDIDDFNLTSLVHGKTDLNIAITESASEKLHLIAIQDKNPDTALKIVVESGGCHGFQYNLNLCDMKQELAADQDDELLAFQRQNGKQGYVLLNQSSLEILQDSKVEYSHELIGSSFKVVDSPYTSTACGCGASFDFDFEKLQKKAGERLAAKSL